MHPVSIAGSLEKTVVKFIIRDFENAKLIALENLIEATVKKVMLNYPKSFYNFIVTEQYRNYKEILDQNPLIIQHALEAVKRAGVTPYMSSIRGGTDGSRLSFMGLPCPNIFAGEHAFHGKHEWVSVQDMHKAVETIIHLSMIWDEKS